ncbi:hypothetical protein MTO96_021091 [Rhipicephalus appendiculatus]
MKWTACWRWASAGIFRAIADNVRPDRQTVVRLTHATKQSRELAPEFTNDSVNVTVGTATQEQQNQRVGHIVFVCKKAKKKDKLAALLKDILSNDSDRAVTFVERQQTVEDLASTLRLQGSPAVGIHAKKMEQEHQGALDVLRQSTTSFLVATNVATKAMEPDNVRFVVSYDHPVHLERLAAQLEARCSARRNGQDVHVPSTRRPRACPGADAVLPGK